MIFDIEGGIPVSDCEDLIFGGEDLVALNLVPDDRNLRCHVGPGNNSKDGRHIRIMLSEDGLQSKPFNIVLDTGCAIKLHMLLERFIMEGYEETGKEGE